MVFRLKRIEKKLDESLKNQEIIINMLVSIIEMGEQRHVSGATQKEKMSSYINNILGLMKANGAPPEMLNEFETILGGLN